VGSRHAAIRLVVAISSALASRFAKSLRKEGTVSAAMCGRASTFKISCSVTADLSKPACLSIQQTTRNGRELSSRTALTKTLVSRTSSSKQRLDFFLSLLDHPIDISSLRPARITRRRDPCRALVSQLSGSIRTVIMRSFGTPRRFAVKLDGGDR
jgi:hypothetical protein